MINYQNPTHIPIRFTEFANAADYCCYVLPGQLVTVIRSAQYYYVVKGNARVYQGEYLEYRGLGKNITARETH